MLSPTRRLVRELPPSERPAARLVQVGGDALSIAELLATILNTPDALALAEELLSRFGLARLSSLTVPELQQLSGVGPAQAARLVAAIALGRRLLYHKATQQQVRSPADAAQQLMPMLSHQEQEHLLVLLLNQKNYISDTIWLYKGSLNSSVVRIGEVFREAIRQQAAAVIVAHNHPSGSTEPSPEDIRVTRELRRTGELLDIELLDHPIIGKQSYTSMKERGLGF